jgi:hypothetical protein
LHIEEEMSGRGSRFPDVNVLNETGTVRADDEDEGQDIGTGNDEQSKSGDGILIIHMRRLTYQGWKNFTVSCEILL